MGGDVIVVGGGVAGLATAACLAEAGRKVTLLEARSRLGGRVHTVFDPELRHPVELGAEFVQGEPEEFFRTIKAMGLELYEVPERHERARQGVERGLSDIEELVDRLLDLRTPDLEDVPVSRLIRERAKAHFTAEELEMVTAFLESFHGADLDRFGTAALAENQAAQRADGDRMFRVAGGYGALVSRLAARMELNHTDVHTEAVVTRIHWQPGQVNVEARTGSGNLIEFTASQAVLTLPLGTLKAGSASAAGLLDPEPDGWDRALGMLEMGLAHRIELQFETAWWIKRDRPAPGFVHGGSEPFPVWWTTTPPELPFLTGWAGGPRAKPLAGRSQEELIRLALQSAASVFGYAAEDLERWLRTAYTHDWASDPFSGGAYSYGGVGAAAARETLCTPVAGTLFLSGEAVAPPGRNATVPGALASGFQTAAALLEPESTLRH
ncbi:MAG TPA: NAD(P)/FAD-dependent oxidoreductase [Gemmatimonadales bacterium]|jgi:monoamine oxidase|nr:NAD(P)/FAD-dependent oxidoreductase [Gemmatimonadales bacterium]